MTKQSSRISLYIKNEFKQELKIKAAKDDVSISQIAGQFLQNWNLGAMGFTYYKDRLKLPEISGIYFVISDNIIRYIGCSTNLRKRFYGTCHHRHEIFNNLDSPIIHWIAIDDSELKDLESILIETINPEINNQKLWHFGKDAAIRIETRLLNKLMEHREKTGMPISTAVKIAVEQYLDPDGRTQISSLFQQLEENPNLVDQLRKILEDSKNG